MNNDADRSYDNLDSENLPVKADDSPKYDEKDSREESQHELIINNAYDPRMIPIPPTIDEMSKKEVPGTPYSGKTREKYGLWSIVLWGLSTLLLFLVDGTVALGFKAQVNDLKGKYDEYMKEWLSIGMKDTDLPNVISTFEQTFFYCWVEVLIKMAFALFVQAIIRRLSRITFFKEMDAAYIIAVIFVLISTYNPFLQLLGGLYINNWLYFIVYGFLIGLFYKIFHNKQPFLQLALHLIQLHGIAMNISAFFKASSFNEFNRLDLPKLNEYFDPKVNKEITRIFEKYEIDPNNALVCTTDRFEIMLLQDIFKSKILVSRETAQSMPNEDLIIDLLRDIGRIDNKDFIIPLILTTLDQIGGICITYFLFTHHIYNFNTLELLYYNFAFRYSSLTVFNWLLNLYSHRVDLRCDSYIAKENYTKQGIKRFYAAARSNPSLYQYIDFISIFESQECYKKKIDALKSIQ